MRANPKLSRAQRVWIRFFLLAVFATMYVRDHCRPAFHAAIGMHPDDYDFKVFRITSEISQQVFPITLDLDHPAFKPGLDRLVEIERAIAQAKKQKRRRRATSSRRRWPLRRPRPSRGSISCRRNPTRCRRKFVLRRCGEERRMSDYAPPIVATLLLWWGEHRRASSISTVSLAAPSPGAWRARRRFSRWRCGASSRRAAKTTAASAYCAFACGLIAWAWQLVSYYMGFITGPAKNAPVRRICAAGRASSRRCAQASITRSRSSCAQSRSSR